MIGVIKPNGSTTTTAYDNKQRVTSTVERTASGAVITGFEYTYDDLSRVVEEKCLDRNAKFCYTYDSLGRVTKRTTKNHCNTVLSEESYSYDAAGNITDAPDSCFGYDTNNRLTVYDGKSVSHDLDGNILNNGVKTFTYDSANRLLSAGKSTYTYNAEDVRIYQHRPDADTTYVYDTNCKLSKLLCKTTGGVVTKYVYGQGLIGEEVSGTFKTYHFDSRGSTVAITNASGNITDTFAYDTYGKLLSRTGTNKVIFRYNGRDGVITDDNELIYMRARYYSPKMRRFINADIIPGEISNAITLNRFAYANGNPVSYVDPFGLNAERGESEKGDCWKEVTDWFHNYVSLASVTGILNIASGVLQMICGAALGVTVGWTGIGVVAAGILIANGAATATQGIGQIVNDVTNSHIIREDNIFRTSAQDLGYAIGGDTGTLIGGAVYDGVVIASSVYAGKVAISNNPPAARTSSNPGVPFKAGKTGLQSGVDPNTLTPVKDLSTLDPQRIANAVKYGGDQAISVSSTGQILDGHHRVADAINNGRMVDVFVEFFK